MPFRGPVTAGPGSRLVAAASVAVMLLSAALLAAAVRAAYPSASSVPAVHAATQSPRAPRPGPATPAPPANQSRAHPRPETRTAPTPPDPEPRAAARQRWRAVLAGLDRRRARAYAESDARLLGRVYTPGSAVLRRDRALLRHYAARGLRVRGLRMSVTDLDVRRRARRTVVLDVGERLAAGTVRGAGVRRPLPADRPDRRVVTLRWRPRQGWRISAVGAA